MKKQPVVYSTDSGRMCPECGCPIANCCCRKKQQLKPSGAEIRIARQTTGRKGKGVSVISGLPLETHDLQELARELKQLCGAGGTVKNGVIEIQSDKRDLMLEALLARGFKAKIAGG